MSAHTEIKEPVYLRNEYEGMAFKYISGGKTFAKFKGGKEWEAHPRSKIKHDTLMERDEITQEEYENF